MATANETRDETGVSNPQIAIAILFGAVLALVGVIAPIFAGSSGELLIFGRNYLHDGVHLLSGLAGIGAGYYAGGKFAREYNVALGIVYAVVTLAGFVFFDLLADLLALNTADNVLHLALALVFLGVGFGVGRGGD